MGKFFFIAVFYLQNLSAVCENLSLFFSGSEPFQRMHLGIYVASLNDKQEIFSLNSEQYFTPASVQKVPTSIAALELLGKDFVYTTDLSYEGTLDKNGILHGNLWIVATGDPTLSLDVVAEWKHHLAQHGIQTIEGKVFLDISCFETALASPYWLFEDLGNYYGAGACGMTIQENSYRITFQPGEKQGDPARVVQIDPPIPDLIYHNEVITGAANSGDLAYVFSSEYSPIQYYRGSIPLDKKSFTIKAAMPDPARFCAALLEKHLHPSKGVFIVREKSTSSSHQKLLHKHRSKPLEQIIEEMNQQSINLYAEHLLKTIGSGQAALGAQKVGSMLAQWGIPSQIKDGAGLARQNLITPKGLVLLLAKARSSPIYPTFYASLPEPSKKGTLQSMPAIPGATIRAKTGSMSNVFAIAGYLTLESGQEYGFAILCNNYQGSLKELKKEAFSFLQALASEVQQ